MNRDHLLPMAGVFLGGTTLAIVLVVADLPVAAAAAVGLGIGAVLVAALRPWAAIAMMAFLYAPFAFVLGSRAIVTIGGYELTVTRATGLLVATGLALRLLLRLATRTLPSASTPIALFLVFAGYLYFSLLFTPSLALAFPDVLRFTIGLIVFLSVYAEASRRETYRMLFAALRWASALGSLVTIVLWAIGAPYFMRHHGIVRALGAFGSVNDSANMAVFGIATLLPWIGTLRGFRTRAYLFYLFLVFHALAIALTISRSAILGALVLLVSWFFFHPGSNLSMPRKIALLVVTACVFVAVIYATAGHAVVVRFEDVPGIGTSFDDPTAGSGRVGLWRGYFRIYLQQPLWKQLFGAGVGATWTLGQQLVFLRLLARVLGPHNEYLWLLLETGILGFCLYLSFVVSTGRSLWRASRYPLPSTERDILLAALAYLVSYQLTKEFFGWGITQLGLRWYFLVLLALSLRIAHDARRHVGYSRGSSREDESRS